MEYHGTSFSLVQLKAEDADSLNKMMLENSNRFERFLPVTLAQNLSFHQSETYINTKAIEWQHGLAYTLAIKTVDEKAIAGLIILKNLDWDKKQGEFAYCISEKFGANGWVTKAVGAFVSLAVKRLKIHNFQIIAHLDNYSSVKVAKNNGFQWVKTLKDSYTDLEGKAIDMELFELKIRN